VSNWFANARRRLKQRTAPLVTTTTFPAAAAPLLHGCGGGGDDNTADNSAGELSSSSSSSASWARRVRLYDSCVVGKQQPLHDVTASSDDDDDDDVIDDVIVEGRRPVRDPGSRGQSVHVCAAATALWCANKINNAIHWVTAT